jgi:hypothetical protein
MTTTNAHEAKDAAPRFIGCADWDEFAARSGLPLPEPGDLVFAEIEPTSHRPGVSVNVLWRDGRDYGWVCASLFPEDAEELPALHVEQAPTLRADAYARLKTWVMSDRMSGEGLDRVIRSAPALIAAMSAEVDRIEADMAAEGVRVLYSVEGHSGDYVSFEAVYDDLDTAIAHAKAAKRHADATRDEEDDEFVFYRVGHVQHRRTLPPHLRWHDAPRSQA